MSEGYDTCGAPTQGGDGPPCQHPTTDDGDSNRCWIDAHNHADPDAEQPGRPSKFTDERARQAIAAAELGKSLEGCGRDAGVDGETVSIWKDTDELAFEGPDGNQYEFFGAFRRARGTGETYYIREGRDVDGDVDPSFAKFMLASSYEYKKTDKHEHTGEDGDSIKTEVVIGGDGSA